MNAVAARQTYTIAERFDKALKTIRCAVAAGSLEGAGEFAVDQILQPSGTAPRSRIFPVDCPVLVFEALALDRAAALFFPIHVLVSSAGDQTSASLLNPAELFDARLPAGAAEPMERLQARVAEA